MTPARFLESRRPVWDRLETLLSKSGGSPRGLSEGELLELAGLYPGVAVDVARARMYRMDEKTAQRINQLALRAHGVLYRRRRRRGALRAIGEFLARGYPRLVRRCAGYLAVSAALFFAAALFSYVSVRLDPPSAYAFQPYGLDVPGEGQMQVTAGDVSERYRLTPGSIMAGAITTNNIGVAFLAFVGGALAGVGTCLVLVINGNMLGAFFAHFANHGLSWEVWSFLTPHGALEIFAILVSGGAGLRLGLALAIPGRLTRGAAFRHGAREAVGLVLGTIPMFVVAGAIESFVTPSHWPGELKIAIGLAALAVTAIWLIALGRGDAGPTRENPSPRCAG